jgi:hypothetical protein
MPTAERIRLKPNQLRRFMEKVAPEPNTGCWLWYGAWGGGGYPVVNLYCVNYAAHRVAYEHFVGPIGEGLQLDHLCRVRCCVNPAHVEPVTPIVNTMRGDTAAAKNAAKTHCPMGHPYSGSNLYIAPKTGDRMCKKCSREHTRAWRLRGVA